MSHPDFEPVELDREHVRGWLVHLRETRSSSTARGWSAGVRHFCRWLQSEGEADRDATAGIRTPAPGDPATPVLSDEDLRCLLATCIGREFTARRDNAIIMLFLDGGLRLSQLADLQVADVDLRDRMVFVAGKASRRSGPRHRAVPLGVKAARAVDRYLRERRRHPYAETPRLWLGSRGRPVLTADGIEAMLERSTATARPPPPIGLPMPTVACRWATASNACCRRHGCPVDRALIDRAGQTPNKRGRPVRSAPAL
jgi:integrase/recombinase XerC